LANFWVFVVYTVSKKTTTSKGEIKMKNGTDKKENGLVLYCKLVMLRVIQTARFFGMLFLIGICVKNLWESISVYIEYREFPSSWEWISIITYSIGVTILSTVKGALNDKVDDVLSSIQHRRHLMNRKAELRLKYVDQLADESAHNEHKKNNLETGTGLTDLLPVRKFEVQKIQKEDAKKLDSMIGLDSVKDQIKRVRARISYEKKHGGEDEKSVMHCRFIGSPGTGKTTVAKAMAAIFYDAGIIKKPRYVEINANELQGKYLGETPLVVNELFKQAAGGLIFIDEAYALATCAGSSDKSGYAMEAVTTLLTHLENNTSGTVVIFAGYEHEIDQLFDMNPGLRSRVPIKLEFKDYTSQQLLDILELNLSNRGHVLSADVKPILKNLFEEKIALCRRYGTAFGNGRYVRNVSDELHTQHSVNYEEDPSIGTAIQMKDIIPEVLFSLD